MNRRYAVSLPTFAALGGLLLFAAARCGSEKKDNNQKGTVAPATTGALTSTAPADWDGKQDWAQSEWEVVEE